MRFHFILLSVIAATASAIPKILNARASSKSQASISKPGASTTPLASKSTSGSASKTTSSDASDWTTYHNPDHDIDVLMDQYADDVPDGTSYTSYVLSKAKGVNKFTTQMGYESQLISTGDGCEAGSKTLNPKVWFILNAIQNAHSWVEVIYEAVVSAQNDFNTMQPWLESTFITHKFEAAPETWRNSVGVGVLGAFSSIMTIASLGLGQAAGSAVTFSGSLSGLASGGLVIDNGVLAGILADTVGVIENQIQIAGNTAKYMVVTINALKSSIEHFGDNAINGPAYNPPTVSSQYLFNDSGIVQLIKGGNFASPPSSEFHFKATNATAKSIYSIAITNLWSQQDVYIVNASNGDAGVYNWRGLAYSYLDITKDDITKYELDGNTYFFMKYTKGKSPEDTYDLVPGLDQIGVTGINETEIILSSKISQSLYGFNHTWSVDDGVNQLMSTNNVPPGRVFFNIPICNFADLSLPDHDHWSYVCDDECMFKRTVNLVCPTQIMKWSNGTVSSWKIDLYDSGWNPN